jgi:SAM-dependent methyltransferase
MQLLLTVFFVFLLISIAFAFNSLAPWVPTKKKDLKRIFKLAALKPDEIFYDLGCGDGRVAIYAAKNINAKVIGLELAWPLCLICKIRQLFHKNKNLEFKFKNLFRQNLARANAVYIFAANPGKLKGKLIKKLEAELKPNVRIITYAFPIAGWQPKIIDKPTKNDISIYLYQI